MRGKDILYRGNYSDLARLCPLKQNCQNSPIGQQSCNQKYAFALIRKNGNIVWACTHLCNQQSKKPLDILGRSTYKTKDYLNSELDKRRFMREHLANGKKISTKYTIHEWQKGTFVINHVRFYPAIRANTLVPVIIAQMIRCSSLKTALAVNSIAPPRKPEKNRKQSIAN